MAFDGEVMSLQTQAAQVAAIVRGAIRSIERRLAWGIAVADQQGATEAAASLRLSLACAKALHASLAASAELVAGHFNDDPSIYSGGDDKPEPDPEGP